MINFIRRISVATGGGQGNDDSGSPSITYDGRYIVFTSDATNLVAGDTNLGPDIFLYDTQNGTTTRISAGTPDSLVFGAEAPHIAAGGRYIVYSSFASDRIANDENNSTDVFLFDRVTGATERVSLGPGGTELDAGGDDAAVSDDGRYVVFVSSDATLPRAQGTTGVYVYDRATRGTEVISVSTSGAVGDSHSYGPAITPDGRFVVFYSDAKNLVPGDTNGYGDIFVRDRLRGTTERVSIGDAGVQGDYYAVNQPAISADGRYVAFLGDLPDAAGGYHAYVHDRETHQTKLISKGLDGQAVAVEPRSRISISADGQYVVFTTDGSGLIEGDLTSSDDVFVYDNISGIIRRVSVNDNGYPGNSFAYSARISGDGQSITFISYSDNLVSGDSNQAYDIFVTKNPIALDLHVFDQNNNTIDFNKLTTDQRLAFATGADRFAFFGGNDKVILPSKANASAFGINVNNDTRSFDGGEGNDVITVIDWSAEINGGAGVDTIELVNSANDYDVVVSFNGAPPGLGNIPTTTIDIKSSTDFPYVILTPIEVERLVFLAPIDNAIDLSDSNGSLAVQAVQLAVEAYGSHPAGSAASDPLAWETGYTDAMTRSAVRDRKWHPVSAMELGIAPGKTAQSTFDYSYSFTNGQYSARANFSVNPKYPTSLVSLEQNASVLEGVVDGQKTLMISFRGTDQQGQELSFELYHGFSPLFALFDPLVVGLRNLLSSANFDSVVVSGHSLGGALAQHLMAEFANDERFRALTIGSPGGEDDSTNVKIEHRIVNIIHTHDAVPLFSLIKARQGADIFVNINADNSFGTLEHKQEIYLDTIGALVVLAKGDGGPRFTSTEFARSLRENSGYVGSDVHLAIGRGNSTGHDFISIGLDDEFALGGKGDDIVFVDSFIDKVLPTGRLVIDGGEGKDRLIVESLYRLDPVTGDSSAKSLVVNGRALATLYGIEIVASPRGFAPTSGSLTVQTPPAGASSVSVSSSYDYLDAGDGQLSVRGTGNDDRVLIGTGMRTVSLGSGNDTIIIAAGAGHDATVDMGAGDDSVLGGNGAKSVAAGAGNDLVVGGNGDNLFNGDAGDDILKGGAGNDTLNGGIDNDRLSGDLGNDVLTGGDGIDTADYSSSTTVTIVNLNVVTAQNTGSSGIDTLAGIENLIGGSGADRFTGSGLANTLAGGLGDDTLRGGGGDDLLSGERGDDLLIGDADNDTLLGGDGADVLEGGGGDDRLDGGDGIDTARFVGATGAVTVQLALATQQDTGGAGSDTLVSIENLIGSAFDDILTGDAGANLLAGGAGADRLNGAAGVDRMEGGAGNDIYYVEDARDVVVEATGEGIDTVYTGVNYRLGAGSEIEFFRAKYTGATGLTLQANSGSTQIFGGAAADRLIGGAAADRLDGGAGADRMEGGLGNDMYYVDSASDLVLEAAGAGSDTIYASVNYTLRNGQEIEALRASYTGSTGLTLRANTGPTQIFGGAAADRLIGGAAADRLDGGAGADRMEGGLGNDMYYVDNASDLVLEAAGAGSDTIYASVNYTLRVGSEIEALRANYTGSTGLTLRGNTGPTQIFGGAAADRLIGGAAADRLNGGGGADRLEGGLGNDIYYVDNASDLVLEAAGAGSDTVYASVNYTLRNGQEIEALRASYTGSIGLTLRGNTGPTQIFGGAAADTLIGGAAADRLDGGNGADVLDGKAGADRMSGNAGNDFYYVDNASDLVLEAAGAGTDTIYTNVNYTLRAGSEVEFLRASYTGSTGLTLRTLSGATQIVGGTAVDRLYGGDAADVLDGKAGADRMEGGLGDDIYYVDNAGDIVIEANGGGDDTVYASVNYTLRTGSAVQVLAAVPGRTTPIALTGNEYGNRLIGGTGNDTLDGGAGRDTLEGGLGNDTYVIDLSNEIIVETAGRGTDTVLAKASYALAAAHSIEIMRVHSSVTAGLTLTGNAEGQQIFGGVGDDRLRGLGGEDFLTGKAGADTFIFAAATDSALDARDRILDFSHAEGDRIDLSALLGPALTFIGSSGFTDVGQVRVTGVVSPNYQTVSVNLDADADAELAILVKSSSLLVAGDFIL